MNGARGERICAALLAGLQGKALPASLHSRFHGAANLSTGLGLVTLLSPGRSLQPYAICLDGDFDYSRLELRPLLLSPRGLTVDGSPTIHLEHAVAIDLRLLPGPTPPLGAAWVIRRFLSSAPEDGLARLALGRTDGPYAELLAPRLELLRRAVRRGAAEDAAQAARRMAGCGPGLTPSSDDLLCGYLALLPSVGPWAGMGKAMAASAALGTNAISAALLRQAGAGRFSLDVLELIARLRAGGEGQDLTRALLRVASFGSSSGYDLLTGVYFGVLDACAIGGMYIDQAGGT